MDSFRKWKENSVTKGISLRKQCLERNKYFIGAVSEKAMSFREG